MIKLKKKHKEQPESTRVNSLSIILRLQNLNNLIKNK
jgi:hypothetical protein